MSFRVAVIVLVSLAVALLAGVLVARKFMFSDYYQDVVLETEFRVTSEWREVPVAGELRAEKDHQFIAIGVQEPLQAFLFDGIRLENGNVAKPQVKLVDRDGAEYLLEHSGNRRWGELEFSNYENKHTKGKVFQKIFIRCDSDFLASSVNWAGYDAKDLP